MNIIFLVSGSRIGIYSSVGQWRKLWPGLGVGQGLCGAGGEGERG